MSSSTPPPSGGPEFLDQTGGEPVGPDTTRSGGGGGARRTALVAGGAVVGLGLVGGAAWAAMSFFATGSQPAEALPAGTLGYASVDLDPSGSQKIEALEMIKKFPSLDKELGGINADDDLLAKVFAEADCEGLSYDDDVKPWLGYRFAVAAVDLGDDAPTPVGVLQVSDAGAAEDGLAQLAACHGEGDAMGWVVEGDWAVVAETDDLAQQVVDATGDGTLADDEDFQRWTGEVGDPGVMTMYAAPEAAQALAELSDEFSPGTMLGMPMDPMGAEGMESSPEMTQALENFQGMAATVRFSDGALEIEGAAATGSEQTAALSTDRGDDVLATLPEDTAAALGFGLGEGWLTTIVDQAVASSGGEMSAEDLEAQLQAMAGLSFDDVETAFGESAVLAVGSDIDPEAIFSSADGSSIPVGAKIQGDAAAIEDVFGKISQSMGPEAGTFLGTDADGDYVAVGPSPDFRSSLLGDGNLGDSAVYQNVIREGDDASAVFFVNFDANDWLAGLLEGQQEAQDDVAPLEGLGMTSWVDDGTSHGVLRLTTD
ncbi:hypothetical protein GCM10009623_02960 [Nocardioides aestuarii]|uniref:DUF3352 domain-containing protein n=1 Tax=Nocardioides aestuarii TaxID=252231 RepID=A0ABW4TL32_9ACTN